MHCKGDFCGLEPFIPETINVLIADDKKSIEELTEILSTDPMISISAADKLDEVEDHINATKPDILFIDPSLEMDKGMQLIDRLIAAEEYPEIIIAGNPTTSGGEKQIRVKVMTMINKPFTHTEVHGAMRNYLKVKSNSSLKTGIDRVIASLSDKKFKFSTRKGHVFLRADEIIYCKADSNYTHLVMTEGRQITVSKSLHHFDNNALSPHYYRISRSAIINTAYLVEINRNDKNCILKQNGEYISLPVTQKYLKNLLDHYCSCYTLNQ
jgi:two-component system LytT family response regulator